MKSTVEPVEGNKVKLSVEVDEAEVEKAVEAAFRQIAREVRIPGFRPGKAPRRVLEARLGPGVARGQALNDAIPDYYSQAVREHEVDVIAQPEIDITEGEETGPVVFEATVEVRPEITLGGYEALRVVLDSPTVSDDEIDEQIDRLRRVHSTLETVDRPATDEDVVVIDIDGLLDGEPAPGLTAEDYSYEVGSGGIVEEVDEQLRGAKVGDILEFTADHPVQEDAELQFRILVKEVQTKILPDADDEFAAEASEFETMAELRADLVERATSTRKAQAQAQLREKTGQALAALVDQDIPDAMVSNELQERISDMALRLQAQGLDIERWLAMQGRTAEQFVEELRGMAEVACRVDLALRAVATQEDLEVSDDDLEAEWQRVAERVEASVDEVREQFEHGGQVKAIRSDLAKRKAFDWLLERVEIVDEDGTPIDRALFDDEAADADTTDDTDAGGPDEAAGPEDREDDE
ncbi:MAG: trigger factor [Acidimicrobiia bacterium]|nr:trigger factor [Acidimicrobiia bacterium]